MHLPQMIRHLVPAREALGAHAMAARERAVDQPQARAQVHDGDVPLEVGVAREGGAGDEGPRGWCPGS
ncbi:hypothetical protein Tdes44962_MAKER09000 [Teratosphaeria destructans]|uniref:Uncharacterized protein n=1 Tax=Teratosphaeria destructans TaxID=418781 RepID=A0A9W7SUM7_9PEZI|nr:hypothetical protein Tdes44962_MAKER09000 [Teratosphaeria destructans]